MADLFRFCIDRGGTFTDVYAEVPAPPGFVVLKLLSEDPDNYPDAPTEGIRRVLERVTGVQHPRGVPIDASRIEWIRMGTTVATNALLEREGEPLCLATTAGFADLLEIGTQARPNIFDLRVATPPCLHARVLEVDERVRVLRADEADLEGEAKARARTGPTGERVELERPLDRAAALAQLRSARASGLRSLAVVLLHATAYPAHELALEALAREAGFEHVSLSHLVSPTIKAVPRGQTACVDAYLTPVLRRYLASFARGFVAGTLDLTEGEGGGGGGGARRARVQFMQSDGGLARASAFLGCRAILSGPAGGVVGYAATTARACGDGAVLGFDMGGTSTDVSRYEGGGRYELVFETLTAGVRVAAAQLDISTVAAGGGSRLFFRDGALAVGPESAKAMPGPVCYRRPGGVLAVTDANAVLGRLQPRHFPPVFGPAEDEPLDVDGARAAMAAMAAAVNAHARARALAAGGPAAAALSVEEVAAGFVRVANEAMCRPVRELSEARGYELRAHTLACFGGAAPQHCCALARALGIRRVFVHRLCGILSAYGLGLADAIVERSEPAAGVPLRAAAARLARRHASLEAAARAELGAQGLAPAAVRVERYLGLRYAGTDSAIMLLEPEADGGSVGGYEAALAARFRREFGFELGAAADGAAGAGAAADGAAGAGAGGGRAVVVDDVRVRAVGCAALLKPTPIEAAPPAELGRAPPALERARVYFGAECAAGGAAGWVDARVYELRALRAGHALAGPALVVGGTSTLVLEPGCTATVSADGDLVIEIGRAHAEHAADDAADDDAAAAAAGAAPAADADAVADPILLSVLGNRFMSIAEQMGRTLQRAASSVNIKERLDFSCALFRADGSLVANAPHVPVHLGAMAETVAAAAAKWRGRLRDGDVLITNDPAEGGSHLPDITVITPVVDRGKDDAGEVIYYVASRGHHADVGGLTPGSMPNDSKALCEEGALFSSFKLVSNGAFATDAVLAALRAPAAVARAPGEAPIAGCRNEADVLSDLRAQVAANTRGVALLRALELEYGRARLVAYMEHVQAHAEAAVRALLRDKARALADEAARGGSRADGAIRLVPAAVDADGVATAARVVVRAADAMDDGTAVALELSIEAASGRATFDFSRSGAQVLGNWNAPTAITSAAVIYCLRLLLERDVPLNSGCLRPVAIVLRAGSVLAPARGLAVCAGNVLTSMRVTDVILRAFRAVAASQGCMNNLTCGDASFGYYETIAGGCGAGPGWDGTSAVQCHMTNTRITDVEILERRFPVAVRAFAIRRGSGGAGEWRGGDGVVRELEVLRDGVTVTLLTERRVLRPFGMRGGRAGAAGANTLTRATSGERVSLGGKNRVLCCAGDRIRVETPGGGGWGAPRDAAAGRAADEWEQMGGDGGEDGGEGGGGGGGDGERNDGAQDAGALGALAGGARSGGGGAAACSSLRGTASVALSTPGHGVEF